MKVPDSTTISRSCCSNWPARSSTLLDFSASTTSRAEVRAEASWIGSSSTRIRRGRPPITVTRLVSRISFSSNCNCSASRRSSWSPYSSGRSDQSVTLTIGTSSTSTGLTTQPSTDGGIWSVFDWILL